MTTVDIVLVRTDYDIYSASLSSINITERQAQIMLSLGVLALQRDNWDSMTDAQWDVLNGEIASAIHALTEA